MSENQATPAVAERTELRRDVTIWGSYTWGYAAVGADIYVALGLVIGASQGGAPLAFGLAGIVYILIGLAFTELASSYPVAGGGQYYTLRGLGDLLGFTAGTALLLDYTIDIALFTVASTGYLNFFLPFLGIQMERFILDLGPFQNVNVLWMGETLVLIILLRQLNVRGIRESSRVNEVLGLVDLVMEAAIVVFGFILAWRPELLVYQWQNEFPTLSQFLYGFSLGIVAFVGLESISQAAQETRRPATVIPRTSLALIFSVFILALGFSTVALGILPWQEIKAHDSDPVAHLAHNIPYLGVLAGPFAAFLGTTILLISANSGVMGASRLIFSMSQFKLVGGWFRHVHPRFHTPNNAINSFALVSIVMTIIAFLTPSVLDTLANLYAFGATLGYMLVFLSLLRLRYTDPYSPRPYKVPGNIRWKRRDGTPFEIPLLAILGFLGVTSIFVTVIATHEIGRIVGPAWVLLCLIYFVFYRRAHDLAVFKNTERDWEGEQMDVLGRAEEFELLEEYRQALVHRDRRAGVRSRWETTR